MSLEGAKGMAGAGGAPVLTAGERRLLDAAQSRFPLVAAPYAALAEEAGWTEAEVLDRFRSWVKSGLVRRLGAVFDSGCLGYRSALLATRVPAERLEAVAAAINACPGVTHNYLRDDAGTGYNLWFTFTVGPGEDLEAETRRLTVRAGLDGYLLLPATRLYKIKVAFPLSGGEAQADGAPGEAAGGEVPPSGGAGSKPVVLSDEERRVVRAFTRDLPVVERPFARLAAEAGVSEERALSFLADFRRRGVIRRFGATLKHYAVGYPANAMSVWLVGPAEEERVARILSGSPAVTHCYSRPVRPGWPYNLFAMLHGATPEACRAEAERLAQAAGIPADRYRLLFTERELKKERLWYGGEGA